MAGSCTDQRLHDGQHRGRVVRVHRIRAGRCDRGHVRESLSESGGRSVDGNGDRRGKRIGHGVQHAHDYAGRGWGADPLRGHRRSIRQGGGQRVGYRNPGSRSQAKILYGDRVAQR